MYTKAQNGTWFMFSHKGNGSPHGNGKALDHEGFSGRRGVGLELHGGAAFGWDNRAGVLHGYTATTGIEAQVAHRTRVG